MSYNNILQESGQASRSNKKRDFSFTEIGTMLNEITDKGKTKENTTSMQSGSETTGRVLNQSELSIQKSQIQEPQVTRHLEIGSKKSGARSRRESSSHRRRISRSRSPSRRRSRSLSRDRSGDVRTPRYLHMNDLPNDLREALRVKIVKFFHIYLYTNYIVYFYCLASDFLDN